MKKMKTFPRVDGLCTEVIYTMSMFFKQKVRVQRNQAFQ